MSTSTNHTPHTTAPDTGTFHGSSLELRNLTMAYGDIEVLRNVSLTVAPGTTTCIIGPSGSGKSTLLRGVNRLHEPKSGDVLLAGESALNVKPDLLRARIGMVFQHFNLFPDHTALENVALALWSVKGMPKAEARARAHRRLTEVGLAERADHAPATSPAASNNASRSPGPWPWNRKSCSSTKPPAPWTPNSSKAS